MAAFLALDPLGIASRRLPPEAAALPCATDDTRFLIVGGGKAPVVWYGRNGEAGADGAQCAAADGAQAAQATSAAAASAKDLGLAASAKECSSRSCGALAGITRAATCRISCP